MMTLDRLIQALVDERERNPEHGSAPVLLWSKFPAGKATAISGVTVAQFGPMRWTILDEGGAVDPTKGEG